MAASGGLDDSSSSLLLGNSRMECPVCCEKFRNPKCLSCGHSLCEECCGKLLDESGISIPCPVCRRSTRIPTGGLPTNFALQDAIQGYETAGGDQRRLYDCAECGRSCTAEEAWVVDSSKFNPGVSIAAAFGLGEMMIPRCFRCIIRNHAANAAAAGNGSSASSSLPSSLESVADAFRRYENDLSALKRHTGASTTEQREWLENLKHTLPLLSNRSENIALMCRRLTGMTAASVEKTNGEFEKIRAEIDASRVPESLDEFGDFGHSMRESYAELERIAEKRAETTERTNVAANSLAIGFECLMNAIDEQEREKNGRIMAAAAAMEHSASSSSHQSAAAALNIFSISPSSSSGNRSSNRNRAAARDRRYHRNPTTTTTASSNSPPTTNRP